MAKKLSFWKKHMNKQGHIDLVGVFLEEYKLPTDLRDTSLRGFASCEARRYLKRVMKMSPVSSRQVAAIAIAYAHNVYLESMRRAKRSKKRKH